MSTEACPNADQLASWLTDEESEPMVTAHMATCPACQTRLTALRIGVLTAAVPGWGEIDEPPPEGMVERLMQCAKSPPGVEPDEEPAPAAERREAPEPTAAVLELDRHNAAQVIDEVNEHLRVQVGSVVIHLRDPSSRALAVLVSCRNRVRAAGGELRVVVDDPEILSILKLTRLDQVLSVYGSAEDAHVGIAIRD